MVHKVHHYSDMEYESDGEPTYKTEWPPRCLHCGRFVQIDTGYNYKKETRHIIFHDRLCKDCLEKMNEQIDDTHLNETDDYSEISDKTLRSTVKWLLNRMDALEAEVEVLREGMQSE